MSTMPGPEFAEPMQSRRPTVRFAWIVAGLVFVCLSGLSIRSGDELRYPDERDYHALAQSLLQHQGFVNERGQPSAYRPPGYPFVLTALYSVWNRPMAA